MTDECDTSVTRRRTLRIAGSLAIAGGLAGCTGAGDGEGGEDGESTTAEDGPTDRTGTATTRDGTKTEGSQTEGTGGSTDGEAETTSGGDLSTETVTFPSSVGEEVTATKWGDGDCAAVFLHGVGYDRSDWEPQASAVAEDGYTALSLSLDHDDRESNVEATVGAVDYLRGELGVQTVVLVGASAGANAVVKTDANTDVDVAGSVILAPGRAGDLGANLSGRTLFVVGKGDSDRFVQTTKRLHGDAPGPKELVVLDSSEHAQGIFATSEGDRLQSLIVEFVNTVCSEA